MSDFEPWFDALFPVLPGIAIWSLGIVLAFRLRRRLPRVAVLAGMAFGTFLLVQLFEASLVVWRKHHEQADLQFQQSVFLAKNIVFPIVSALAWVALLFALFAWRGQAETDRYSQPGKVPPGARSSSQRISLGTAFGAFVGACTGGILAAVLDQEAPFLTPLFGTTTSMVLLVSGWGAVIGAAITATEGLLRGAIAGGVAGLAIAFAWAARQSPEGADRVLRTCPFWFILAGAVIGGVLARGWDRLSRK